MRLYEFDATKAKIVSLLTQLKTRAGDKESAKIRTSSFLNMLRNLGVSMSVDGLNSLIGKDNGIQRSITSVDDKYVNLNMQVDVPQDDFMGDEGGDLDLGMDDEGDEGGDELDLGMDDEGGEEAGTTTDDFEEPEMGGQAAKADTVDNMAKRALSRRM